MEAKLDKSMQRIDALEYENVELKKKNTEKDVLISNFGLVDVQHMATRMESMQAEIYTLRKDLDVKSQYIDSFLRNIPKLTKQ